MTYQIGYYRQANDEIIWKQSRHTRLRDLQSEADEWVTQFEDSHPWSMVVIAKNDADTVTRLRYLDEDKWIVSGKGIPVDND
jgi:hypothetical protein